MLQAPSHFSRVCGHGHIKKFWLMQTQKENQACESKSNVSFSSPSCPVSRGSVKGLESSPWSSTSPVSNSGGYGDAGTPKHSSFTCAESLSPSSKFCKEGPSLSPHSTASSGTLAYKESICTRLDVDSCNRILENDVHPATPSPRSLPLNVTTVLQRENFHNPVQTISEADPESLPPYGCCGLEDPLSSSMESSPNLHGIHESFTRVQPGNGESRALQGTAFSQAMMKVGDNNSCIQMGRDLRDAKALSGITKLPMTCTVLEGNPDRGLSIGLVLGNQTQDHNDRDCLPQTSYEHHPALKACTLCGTTKTPMWRSGPQGPKSLCNACGIRFKKYRCFPGQSESPEIMASPVGSKSFNKSLKRKQSSGLSPCEASRPLKMCVKAAVAAEDFQMEKKSKWNQLEVKREQSEFRELARETTSPWSTHSGPASFKKIYGCAPFQPKFKKFVPLDEHRSVSRVFAKDEEEAAALLMHLSCGLVY